jgi:alpha-tubulin suppressor-like RCC1 family protein
MVSAGALHTCVLLEDLHSVRCWGSGAFGRLGGGSVETIGDDETAAASVSFSFGEEVVQLEAGRVNSCVRTVSGAVHCWGRAAGAGLGVPGSEDIGDDELASSAPPVDIGGLALDLSVDDHACAVVDDEGVGVLRCWGTNDQGELGAGQNAVVYVGDDENPAQLEPVRLGFTAHVHAARAGVDNTCAIVDEQVRCWGDGYWGVNANATINDIGDDEYPYVSPPGVLIPGEYALEIAVGEFNACALLDNHRVRCWGRDETGLLGYELLTEDIGDDEYGYVARAHQLGASTDGGVAQALALGDHHACVLTQAGRLRCWGSNESGQLGYGDTDPRGDAPGELESLPDLALVAN